MKSRRLFIKTLATGEVMSPVALYSATTLASHVSSESDSTPNRIRIGIIGAENSRTAGYGEMIIKKR